MNPCEHTPKRKKPRFSFLQFVVILRGVQEASGAMVVNRAQALRYRVSKAVQHDRGDISANLTWATEQISIYIHIRDFTKASLIFRN